MAGERSERIEVGEGSFGAFVALPEGGAGPGLLLLHEIFGIADFAKGKARDLAAAGHVVLVPDVFWRLEPGFVAPDTEEGVQQGMAMANRFFAEVPPERVHPGAGHAFENSFHPMFWNPNATASSWRQTLEFLARSLGS